LLFKNIFIFCAMASSKRAPDGKGEPSHKCTDINLEMRIRMVLEYAVGQSLSAVAR
jgi:NH3-dependent NAD+ synthetase